ncbi:MAG: hypothetical protein K0U98_11375 [Deltaproteobacteria bacterium]|nr:hypothetical protein [Deltaproteobacteria bacterium]
MTLTRGSILTQDAFFKSGRIEAHDQAILGFNDGTNGAIQLDGGFTSGDFAKETFFKFANGVSHRDPNSDDPVADIAHSQDEFVEVKIFRKFGPWRFSLASLREAELSEEEFNLRLGQVYQRQKLRDMFNTAVIAAQAALKNVANLQHDGSGDAVPTLNHSALWRGKSKLGDRMESVVFWVMHSVPWGDLNIEGIQSGITNVSNTIIYGGHPGTLGIPSGITDAPALFEAGTPNKYWTLGLQAGAVTIRDQEGDTVVSDLKTGGENISLRLQGEYSFSVKVMGSKWDTGAGGSNPDDATLGVAANWLPAASSTKDMAGVAVLSLAQ